MDSVKLSTEKKSSPDTQVKRVLSKIHNSLQVLTDESVQIGISISSVLTNEPVSIAEENLSIDKEEDGASSVLYLELMSIDDTIQGIVLNLKNIATRIEL